jgi:hypothetical protein
MSIYILVRLSDGNARAAASVSRLEAMQRMVHSSLRETDAFMPPAHTGHRRHNVQNGGDV